MAPGRVQKIAGLMGMLTVLIMLTVMDGGGTIFRVTAGIVLVLILPGYVLTTVLFRSDTFRISEQLLVILSLSLAVTALGGFILNLTPWGLQPASWMLWLGGVTLVAAVIGLYKRGPIVLDVVKLGPHFTTRDSLLFGLAGLTVVAAIIVAAMGAIKQPTTPVTQLWILPAAHVEKGAVQLGVANFESETVSYKLQIELSDNLVYEWSSITLEPYEQWEVIVALPPSQTLPDTVAALLYRMDEPELVYRRVNLWRAAFYSEFQSSD